MKYRTFGRLGWKISDVGCGMWGMGAWSGSDDQESLNALQRSLELGCNFFDTAWVYGNGHSEKLLGQLVRANPAQKLHLASKIPPKNMKWPARKEYSLDDCYPPDHIQAYIETTLKNIGVETLDLIQLHTWNDEWMKDERWVRKLENLRSQKLIGAFGLSLNRGEPWNGIQAVRSGLVDAVQVVYNIFDQDPEDELFPACQEKNVAVIARVPFDEGSLTGNLTPDTKFPKEDWRSNYFSPEYLKESCERVERLRSLLPVGVSVPELALRYILSHVAVSTVIPGMRRVRHVEANLAASDAGPLAPALVNELHAHRWVRDMKKLYPHAGEPS